MKVIGDWLTAPATQAVMAMLTDAGHQALAVGGCVRNALLGAEVSDIDIATDALPDHVMQIARDAGMKPVPTGLEHGTITVIADGIPHEVTTFRKDVETDGRHAVVTFTGEVAEDARRRDFTMNGLYARADGTVVDPLGGMHDLRSRHIRFIGEAAARIAEDYLRILRFFRFTAWYGDPALGVDAEGLAACAAGADGLDRISAERIGQEMRKLLSAPDPVPAVAAMAQSGILSRVLPGADVTGLGPLLHCAPSCDWRGRLAVLGGTWDRLRLSKADARTVDELATAARDGTPAFGVGDKLGRRGVEAVHIRAALLGQPPDARQLALAERGASEIFPLVAADLMPELAGRALGQALARARGAWRDSDGMLDRDALLAVARREGSDGD